MTKEVVTGCKTIVSFVCHFTLKEEKEDKRKVAV